MAAMDPTAVVHQLMIRIKIGSTLVTVVPVVMVAVVPVQASVHVAQMAVPVALVLVKELYGVTPLLVLMVSVEIVVVMEKLQVQWVTSMLT